MQSDLKVFSREMLRVNGSYTSLTSVVREIGKAKPLYVISKVDEDSLEREVGSQAVSKDCGPVAAVSDASWAIPPPLVQDAHQDLRSVFQQHKNAFSGLLEKLAGEREAKLQPGGLGLWTADVCICLDATGSMSAWLPAVRGQLMTIVSKVHKVIREQHPEVEKLEIRFGVVAYRDVIDNPMIEHHDFTPDVKQVEEFLKRVVAKGGGDEPENMAGALDFALHRMAWQSKVKFLLLIADSPPHGRDYNDDAKDQLPQGAPGAPRIEDLVDEIRKKSMNFMFCPIRPQKTEKVQRLMLGRYDPNDDHKMEVVTLVEGSESGGRVHFIFVLDESGSMSGQPWSELINAYGEFIQRHGVEDQTEGDLVSLVTYQGDARTHFEAQPIAAVRAMGLPSMRGGGTDFSTGLAHANQIMQRCSRLAAHQVVIFMSDGGDGRKGQSVGIITSMRAQHPTFTLHSVAFGGGADTAELQSMATAGGGELKLALDRSSLYKGFREIAASKGASQEIIKCFGERLAKEIANKLFIDYL